MSSHLIRVINEAALVMTARGLTRELDEAVGDGGLWLHQRAPFVQQQLVIPRQFFGGCMVHYNVTITNKVKYNETNWLRIRIRSGVELYNRCVYLPIQGNVKHIYIY